MKAHKKIISILMALLILLSCFTFYLNTFAETFIDMGLDIIYTAQIKGKEDMIWYSYTPEVSGTYVFLAYTPGYSRAYLYTKTTNENGSISFDGLAYAGPSDPNSNDEYHSFEYAGQTYYHYSQGFRLTYHLEAGTTYYYSAGWANSTSTNGSMSVRLTCSEYDNTVIESLSATSNATLTWYTDGKWETDSSGNTYFYYNYSKILQNMTITLTYKDGSTSVAKNGADTIDGYSITYKDNQRETHWYSVDCDEYVANIITITVGSLSYDYEVVINEGALFTVTGYVTDYVTGEGISNASIVYNNSVVTRTDSNGKFSFAYAPGSYVFKVQAANSIPRTFTLNVSAYNTSSNDHTATPISLVVGDYVSDGIINAKDYGYILNKLNGDTQTKEKNKFNKQINFTAEKYSDLIL